MQAQIQIPIPTKCRVLRMAKGCSTVHQRKLVATCKDQKSLNRQEESVISTGKPVATEYQGCSKNHEIPGSSEESGTEGRNWPHHVHISPDCVLHMEKVFSIIRKIYDPKPTDDLKDLDVNTAIWCEVMSVTLQAAVHLGRDYSLGLRSVGVSLRSLWSTYFGQLRS